MSAVRLSVQLSLMFSVALLVGGIWLEASLRKEARDVVDDLLREDYLVLQEEFQAADQLRQWLDADQSGMGMLPIGYVDARGQVYGSFLGSVFDSKGYRTHTAAEIFDQPTLTTLRNGFHELGDFNFDTSEPIWRVYVAPYDGGWIAFAETIEQVEDVIALVPKLLGLVGLPVILLTLGSGLWLGWRQQKRLDRIRGRIEGIAEGQFGAPLAPAQPRDDLDHVMLGIDRAAEKLETNFDRLTHFTQSVAHELRTPLARLRAGLEPHAEQPVAAQAMAQTDEVIRVFEAVQRIARLSGRNRRAEGAQVDLGAVAQLIEDLFADVAEDNQQSLRIQLDAPATVLGDTQLVAQMVSNLVENAIRHAGSGAKITLSVTGKQLSVSDTGRGIPSAQRAHLFDSFTQGRDGGGMGLGLALVRAIADYHEAKITVHPDSDAPGFAITVDFP